MELGEYKCSGKKYNGEKAIISLTSWKQRIRTVSMTIYSILRACPGFHIVLVLSEEEFPKKEGELPSDLMLMADSGLFEILWVGRNWKAFKKVLFTMDKYRDVPVISADDDAIYLIDYADLLYKKWEKNKRCVVSFGGRAYENTVFTWGCYTLYPPYCFGEHGLRWLDDFALALMEDDRYYAALKSFLKIPTSSVDGYKMHEIVRFTNDIKPLRDNYRIHDTNYAYKQFKKHIKI